MCYEFSISEIQSAQKLASELSLKHGRWFASFDPCDIRRICNGIGADWMPRELRHALDALHPSLVVASMIHDLRYAFGDGTDEDFFDANLELSYNGRRLAFHYYPWYDFRRYYAWYKASQFAEVCQIFGRTAYVHAQVQREKWERDNGIIRVRMGKEVDNAGRY